MSSRVRVCEAILRFGSAIRSTADGVIEALEYVNAVAMVSVPGILGIDAAVLDAATETAKEIEDISTRASAIVADVFSKTGRLLDDETLQTSLQEMEALVSRADGLQAGLKTTVDGIETQLFLAMPSDINTCVQ